MAALARGRCRSSRRPSRPPLPPPLQEAGATSFTIFLRGAPIGTEQVAVTRTADGWTIVSSGRLGAPIDVVARRLQVRYTPDWKPLELTLDGTVRGQPQTIRTVVEGTTAKSEIIIAGQAIAEVRHHRPERAAAAAEQFFGPYEALAARLKTAAAGTDDPGLPRAADVDHRPRRRVVCRTDSDHGASDQRAPHAHRRCCCLARQLDADLWTDDDRPAAPLQRAGAVARGRARGHRRRSRRGSVSISRPNDEQVRIPDNGFSLAGTLSKPAAADRGAAAGGVLVGGSGPTDRDEPGVRHSRSSVSSPARSPTPASSSSATTSAASARAAAGPRRRRWPTTRRTCARPSRCWPTGRTSIRSASPSIGHSEGGLVALMAAAKEKRIAAVGLLATPGITGADLVLAQQQRLLDRIDADAGREAGEGRRAEEDPRGGDHRQGAGAAPARRAAHRGQRRVPEPADERSRRSWSRASASRC